MRPDEQKELDQLCQAVIQEKDSIKLTESVARLNEFLEQKERKKPDSVSSTHAA